MSYHFEMVLEGLKSFYFSMRKINVEYGTFEHSYNKVLSDVILDTREKEWRIIFIKRMEGLTLDLPIKRGYLISVRGNDVYKKFIDYFDIGEGKGQFSIKNFMDKLNEQIPEKYIIDDNKRKVILKNDKLDDKSEGIYPIGIINWEVVHAKNKELAKNSYHRTSKNLGKTRELYPEIYMATKDMDITIRYGLKPNENTEKYLKGRKDDILRD